MMVNCSLLFFAYPSSLSFKDTFLTFCVLFICVTILKINFYGHSYDENVPWIIGLIHFSNASEKIFFILCLDFKVFYKFVKNMHRSTSSNVLIYN